MSEEERGQWAMDMWADLGINPSRESSVAPPLRSPAASQPASPLPRSSEPAPTSSVGVQPPPPPSQSGRLRPVARPSRRPPPPPRADIYDIPSDDEDSAPPAPPPPPPPPAPAPAPAPKTRGVKPGSEFVDEYVPTNESYGCYYRHVRGIWAGLSRKLKVRYSHVGRIEETDAGEDRSPCARCAEKGYTPCRQYRQTGQHEHLSSQSENKCARCRFDQQKCE